MKKNYGDNKRMVFTDTDSLFLHIKTEDYYKDIGSKEMKNYFEFSALKENNPKYNISNKKVIGKFKEEILGIPIKRIAAIKPKMYKFE